jgi:hypothetical protein
MNRTDTSSELLLPGVLLVLMSTILCALTEYKPELFASNMPLNFLALAAAARAISKPAQRSFLYNGAAFLLSLSGILILSSAPFKAHTSTFRLLGCWAFAWLSLFFALSLILPRFGIGFRPPSTGTLDSPASKPQPIPRQWTDSIYAATVFLPTGGLLLFFVIGMGVQLFVPHTPLDVNFRIDTATLVLIALLLPLGNLMLWFLFLSQESRAFLVRASLPIKLGQPATILIILAVSAWGTFIQVYYSTGRLLAWAICGSVAYVLLVLLWKLGQQARQSPEDVQPPPLPNRYSLLIRLQVLILCLSGWIYSTLALLTK